MAAKIEERRKVQPVSLAEIGKGNIFDLHNEVSAIPRALYIIRSDNLTITRFLVQ